jgi:hypothetical protein
MVLYYCLLNFYASVVIHNFYMVIQSVNFLLFHLGWQDLHEAVPADFFLSVTSYGFCSNLNVGEVGYLLLNPEYHVGAAIYRPRHRTVTQLFVLWEEHFLYIMYAVHGCTAVTWSALLVCDNGEHH